MAGWRVGRRAGRRAGKQTAGIHYRCVDGCFVDQYELPGPSFPFVVLASERERRRERERERGKEENREKVKGSLRRERNIIYFIIQAEKF